MIKVKIEKVHVMPSDGEIIRLYHEGFSISMLIDHVNHHFKKRYDSQAYIERIVYHDLTGRWVS